MIPSKQGMSWIAEGNDGENEKIKILSFHGDFLWQTHNFIIMDVGSGKMVAAAAEGCSKLHGQLFGNVSISSDIMRAIMDGSLGLFGN